MLSWPVQIKIILFRVSYLGDAQCASQRAIRNRHARHLKIREALETREATPTH